MAKSAIDVKSEALANAVPSTEKVQQNLEKNPHVEQFIKQGNKLLEETNRPNIITVEQFEPFLALYKLDQQKYENDANYKLFINRLYQKFKVGLSINLHEPILVVRSTEDQTVVCQLDRVFTRIKSDAAISGKSAKDNLTNIGPRTDKQKREDMLMGALLTDVARANETPEQIERFKRIKRDSALITKRFVEQNLSPEKREELMKESSSSEVVETENLPSIMFDDDD